MRVWLVSPSVPRSCAISPMKESSSFRDWTVDVSFSERLTEDCLLLKTIKFDWLSIWQSSFFRSAICSMKYSYCFLKVLFVFFSYNTLRFKFVIVISLSSSLLWASLTISFFYFAFLAWSTTRVVCFSKCNLNYDMLWLALLSSRKSCLLFSISFSTFTASYWRWVVSYKRTPSSLRLTFFCSVRESWASL